MNIDVCLVTETFLRPTIPDSYVTIDGYLLFRRDRKICKCRQKECSQPHNGGGVLIYVRSSYKCEIFDTSDESESLWVKLSSTHSSDPLFVNVTYHPPSSNPKPTLDYLNKSLQKITEVHTRSKIFIGGDFNRISLNDLEINFCLTTLDTPPTRADATLDLILTNRPDLVLTTSCFVPSLKTDHLAVLTKPCSRTPPIRHKIQFTDYHFRGFQKLNTFLESTSFSEVYSANNINDAAEILDHTISSCVRKAFPTRTVTISDRDPVWITPKAKWLLLKKKKAKAQKALQKTDQLSNKLESIRLKFFMNHKSKHFWDKVDNISHRKQSNKAICYEAFIPDQLNIDLAERSASQSNSILCKAPFFDNSGHQPPKLTVMDVANVMRKAKRTSPGPSNIPFFVFSEFWDLLAPHYLHVWNQALEHGTFPSIYKHADLIPLPKRNNAMKSEDIRGISVTSIPARLFEKCVHKKWIQPRIESISDTYQFAYKSKLSTLDCLLTLQHYILSLLDLQHIDGIHLVLLDFSKAFDRINQELAATKFPKFIESPFICQWLYDFIINRYQRLIWRKKPCSYIPIDLGCSQGTVGGPSIFSMYTDDLRAQNSSSIAFKYSDDTNILVPCLSLPSKQDQSTLQQEIHSFEKKACDKQMSINKSKTKIMRFSLTSNLHCPCKHDGTYETVPSSKVLGIHFDTNCRFSTHGKRLLSNLKRTLYIIRDLKLNNFTPNSIDTVFHSLITSRIRYGLSVYGSDRAVIKKLDHFLDRCFDKGFLSIPMTASDLLQTEDKRIVNSILSNPLHPLLPFLSSCPTTNTITRQKYTQLKPITRTKLFSSSFCNRVRPF